MLGSGEEFLLLAALLGTRKIACDMVLSIVCVYIYWLVHSLHQQSLDHFFRFLFITDIELNVVHSAQNHTCVCNWHVSMCREICFNVASNVFETDIYCTPVKYLVSDTKIVCALLNQQSIFNIVTGFCLDILFAFSKKLSYFSFSHGVNCKRYYIGSLNVFSARKAILMAPFSLRKP